MKSGSRSTARLTLPGRAAELEPADLLLELGLERARLDEAEVGQPGVDGADHRPRPDLLARLEHDADGPAAPDVDPGDGRLEPDLGSERLGGGTDRVRDAPGPAARDAPGPEGAVDLTHVVVQEDVGRAGALDALVRPDDPGRRHRRDERVGLEPLAEEVGRAHRHELDEHRLLLLGQLLERPQEAGQRGELAGIEPGQVGRHDPQDRLDELGHLDHELAVLLIGLGIVEAPAPELPDRPAVVVDPPQVVVHERGERPVEGQDVEPVLRQVELADDLGSEEAHDVARDAEPEAGEDLLGHGGTAEQMALLEDDGLQPGAGQVGGLTSPL